MPSGAATMQTILMVVGARFLQHVERGYRAAAGREHRIDQHDIARREVVRQLRVVLRRDGRRFVALQADVAHAGRRQQLQHGVEHSQSRAQHRHHDDIARHPPPFGLFERRLNDGAFRRQIAQRLGDQQHADAVGDLAELFGLGVDVAKLAERVVNQRMGDEVH